MSLLQKLGFGAIVFGIGCASSLWLESSQSTNPFFTSGDQYSSPVNLPSRESAEMRRVRLEIQNLRRENAANNFGK